jgi:hypothetical protein
MPPEIHSLQLGSRHAVDADDAALAEVNGPDEADEVLAVPRVLRGGVTGPVARACLEDALEDIAHLTGSGGRPEEAERESDVA